MADRNAELRELAQRYLAEHHTVSLATSGSEGLWATTVFYACDGFTLYYMSEPHTRHARNVAASPQLAATVNEDYDDWRKIKGIQMAAESFEVTDKRQLATGLEIYLKRFPFVRGFLSPGQLLQSMKVAGKLLDTRLYVVRPSLLFYLDNERGFSNRQPVPIEEES
jgi:uncharacterized protein YhbP (UPF0306 family)